MDATSLRMVSNLPFNKHYSLQSKIAQLCEEIVGGPPKNGAKAF